MPLEAGRAVLEPVDDDRDREEPEHDGAQDGAEVRDLLSVAQRDDRDADRDPDEYQLERVVAERRRAELEHVRAPRVVRDERERAADPERVRDPVQDRRDAAVHAAERHLRPLVRPALLRERASHLGHEEHVRGHEDDREHDEPEESLGPVRRDRAERVEPDERTDGEEDHVETAERLDELALLVQRKRGCALGLY